MANTICGKCKIRMKQGKEKVKVLEQYFDGEVGKRVVKTKEKVAVITTYTCLNCGNKVYYTMFSKVIE